MADIIDKNTYNDFVNDIVRLVLGIDIVDIPEEDQEKQIQDCLEIYSSFVLSYIEAKYGKTDATKLKISQSAQGVDIFSKNPDLVDKLEEAFKAFVEISSAPETVEA